MLSPSQCSRTSTYDHLSSTATFFVPLHSPYIRLILQQDGNVIWRRESARKGLNTISGAQFAALPLVKPVVWFARAFNWLSRSVANQPIDLTRPPPSSKNPHFQNEARCTTFLVKMSFICMRMKNDFHIKGWAPTLVLKQRPGGTRKWPIAVQNWVHPIWCYFPFYVGWQCKSICWGKVDAFWLFRRSCLGWRRKGTFYVTQCI